MSAGGCYLIESCKLHETHVVVGVLSWHGHPVHEVLAAADCRRSALHGIMWRAPVMTYTHTHTHLSMSQPTLQYNTNKFVTRSTCQFASEIWSAEMAPKQLRPHSIILATCKPGCKLWACRKHVASRSKACRKQVESQLQTCLKPSDDRTSRLMQQVREQVFDKKSRKRVESMSQTHTNLSKTWMQTWSKARFAARFAAC